MKKINKMLSVIIVAGAFVFGVGSTDIHPTDSVSKESIMVKSDPGGGGGH